MAASTKYLKVYNIFSGVLWGSVLLRLVLLYPLTGPEFVSENLTPFVRAVQLVAVLEIFHALFGLVRSSVLTTAMQVASRVSIIWGIVSMFPTSGETAAYSAMVLAWGITESIRYPYYWAGLNNSMPAWLEKARYTTFIFLYPLGAISEMVVTWKALPYAQAYSPYYALLPKFMLLIWPPSFYVLYSHMWKQRRKALRKLAGEPVKKSR